MGKSRWWSVVCVCGGERHDGMVMDERGESVLGGECNGARERGEED